MGGYKTFISKSIIEEFVRYLGYCQYISAVWFILSWGMQSENQIGQKF